MLIKELSGLSTFMIKSFSILHRFRANRVAAMLLLSMAVTVAVAQEGPDPLESQTAMLVHKTYAFPESLDPTGTTDPNEDAALLPVIEAHKNAQSKSTADSIVQWAQAHPNSPWSPCLLYYTGQFYFREGYFTSAIDCWQAGWDSYKNLTSFKHRRFADASLGELMRMNARLGRMQELEELLAEIQGRDLTSPGAVNVERSVDGLNGMRNRPEIAFRCGPLALFKVREELELEPALHQCLADAKSTTAGFSMMELADFATTMGMNMVPVQRISSTADYPMPSVVHWNLGHYAALLRKVEDRYLIKDPTFGSELWIKQEALDLETSGYFLADASVVGTEYVPVASGIAEGVFGKGYAEGFDLGGVSGADHSLNRCDGERGMPVYAFTSLAAALEITDTPIGYTPPVGPSVDITLRYTHRWDTHDNPKETNFGRYWQHSFGSHIIDNPSAPAGEIKFIPPDGGHINYSYVSAGTYVSPTFGSAKITRTSTSPIAYLVSYPDGSSEKYEKAITTINPRHVALTERIDAQGRKLTLEYNNNDRIKFIHDELGQKTEFDYGDGANSRVKKITDPFGREATFNYNSSTNRLMSITDTIGIASSFTYNSADFITQMQTPYGITTFEKEPSNAYTEYRYIQATDMYGEKERLEYRQRWGNIPWDAASEAPSDMMYDAGHFNGMAVCYWDKLAMRAAPGDPNAAQIVNFLFTPGGDKKTSRLPMATKQPQEHRLFYNYLGQTVNNKQGTSNLPVKIGRRIGSETAVVELEWNSALNPTKIVDPKNRETKLTYDTNGIDLLKIEQLVDGNYQILAQYGSYVSHLPETITDAAGEVTTIDYNSLGQVLKVTNAKGEEVIYEYMDLAGLTDPDGGLLKSITQGSSNSKVVFTYEKNLVKTATSLPDNYTITFDYDALQRVTKVTYPDATYEERVYDRLDLQRSRDRAGRWTDYRYDNLRQLELVSNPAGEVTQFDWCKCGALSRVIDAEGRITAYNYDVGGRLISTEYPDLSKVTRSYIPGTSRVQTVTDAKGQVQTFTYTLDGNLASVTPSNAASGTALAAPVTYSYDSWFDRLSQRTDGIGTTTYAYHPINTGDSILGDGQLASIDGPWTNDTVTYVYDELGRKVRRRILNPITDTFLIYDALGRVQFLTSPLDLFTYNYAGDTGRVASIASISGPRVEYDYYPVAQNPQDLLLKEIRNLANGGGAQLSKSQFTYDVLARITSWKLTHGADEAPGTPVTASLSEQTMRYDLADRLVEFARKRGVATSFTWKESQWNWLFDKAGNRLSQQVGSVSDDVVKREKYTVNTLDQATATDSGGPLFVKGVLDEASKIIQSLKPGLVTEADGSFAAWLDTTGADSATLTFKDLDDGNQVAKTVTVGNVADMPARAISYDLNGNVTQIVTTPPGGSPSTVTYEWNTDDRLVAVVTPTTRSEFTYDGLGRRVKIVEKDSGGSVLEERYFVWDGLEILEERASSGGAATKRFFPQGEMRGGTKYYYTFDHLGSIREVVNASGLVVARYEYDAYGTPAYDSGPLPQDGGGNPIPYTFVSDFRYTGHFYHAPSGLHLAPYRAYDSSLGRWLSREPLGIDGPNLYHYTFNSPLLGIDPTGLQTVDPYPPGYSGKSGYIQSGAGMRQDIAKGGKGVGGWAANNAAANTPLGKSFGFFNKFKRWFGFGKKADKCPAVLKSAEKACFTSGTLVATPAGFEEIQNLQVGDLVRSYDSQSGTWENRRVVRTFEHQFLGELITIQAGGERIEATSNHPFWVTEGTDLRFRPVADDVPRSEKIGSESGRWVAAGDLRHDDFLRLEGSAGAVVTALSSRNAEIIVYNIEVEGTHTYAVSRARLLVHNKAMPRQLTAEAQRGIRSLEKRIAEHQEKLAAFKANPTVRPGMENLPAEAIKAQQAARIRHLETEIKTFQDNIKKLRNGE